MKYIKEFKEFEEDWEEFEEDNDYQIDNNYQIIKDINKQFYNFLVEEGVIDQYINNLQKFKFMNHKRMITHELFKFPIITYINLINWLDSKEGYDFWEDIDKKWKWYCTHLYPLPYRFSKIF